MQTNYGKQKLIAVVRNITIITIYYIVLQYTELLFLLCSFSFFFLAPSVVWHR